MKAIEEKLNKVFASNFTKQVFDTIRNLSLAALVLMAGQYLLITIVPISDSRQTTAAMGNTLTICGFLLMILCVLQGYYDLRKSIRRSAALLFASFYFAMGTIFFATLVRKGGFLMDAGVMAGLMH